MGIPMAHGTTLLAAVPVYAGRNEPREWIVALHDPRAHHPYVVASMNALTDTYWNHGDYHRGAASAMAALYVRAGIYSLPEDVAREVAAQRG